MGYHRPVSQYNRGKKSEFYSRTYYRATESTPSTQRANLRYILLTTPTCQKCPAIKALVQDAWDVPGIILDPSSTEFFSALETYGASQAPTLLVFDPKGSIVFRSSEVQEITDFIQA